VRVSDVRITSLAATDPPLRNSWGVHEPYVLRTLIEITTDDGLVGYGETYGGEAIARDLRGAAANVVGMNPYAMEPLRLRLRSARLFAAFEVALLDIIGKATGESVSEILGGRVRNRVEFSSYLFYKYASDYDDWGEVMTPEAMVGETRRFREQYGFRTHKLKGGVLPPDEEVETLRLLHREFPGDKLRIDPNAVWSVETSIRVARQIEDLNVEYYEDPTWGLAGMAMVAEKTHLPLATNMVVTQFEHVAEGARLGAAQVILGDHHGWGGLRAFKSLGEICYALHLGLSQHSNNHLGISMAAMAHAAAVVPNCLYASDTHYPWQTEDILKGGKLKFTDGALEVPTGPGLGVDVDPELVGRLAEQYKSRPASGRDDVAEMRKRVGDWLPMKPRW
jgi:glucarate dehydratase